MDRRRGTVSLPFVMMLLLAFSCCPALAHAQSRPTLELPSLYSFSFSSPETVITVFASFAAVTGAAALVTSVADLVSYATGSPWSTGWAVFEFVLAGLSTFSGTALAVVAGNAKIDDGWFALCAPVLAMVPHLVIHGIWSLETNRRHRPAPRANLRVDRGALAFDIEVTF